jgi:hypothetical protein
MIQKVNYSIYSARTRYRWSFQKMNRKNIVASLSHHRGRDRISHFRDEPTRKNGLWEFLFVASCRSSE